MKIGLLGHGVVGSGVRKIIDEKLTDETKKLEITKILVKDVSEITDVRMTTDVNEILLDPYQHLQGVQVAFRQSTALDQIDAGMRLLDERLGLFPMSVRQTVQARCIHDDHRMAGPEHGQIKLCLLDFCRHIQLATGSRGVIPQLVPIVQFNAFSAPQCHTAFAVPRVVLCHVHQPRQRCGRLFQRVLKHILTDQCVDKGRFARAELAHDRDPEFFVLKPLFKVPELLLNVQQLLKFFLFRQFPDDIQPRLPDRCLFFCRLVLLTHMFLLLMVL